MNLDPLNSLMSRLFFFGAFVLLLLAMMEKVVNWFGFTILRDTYRAGRLLEFATILLIFVIAILLRQMREELRKPRA
jgi:hypothetical protein